MTTQWNEPAFPYQPLTPQGTPADAMSTGMTLRDYFAAKAMAALIASPRSPASAGDGQIITVGMIADLAYKTADAMLVQRLGGSPGGEA